MKKSPNILFFFTDQQRADTCGCYGQSLNTTPHLDAMAANGVKFNAFTAQPVCGPTRAILQTGRYATEINCHRNDLALDVHQPTIAKQLSKAGYEVGYIGKWHLASQGEEQDFKRKPVPMEYRGGYKDFWLASDVLEFTSHGYDGHMFDGEGQAKPFPDGRFRADAQTDWVLDYLESRDLEKPFFLFNSYIEPHHQNDRNCYEGPHGSKTTWANYDVPGDLAGAGGNWEENYPDYLGCIHALDQGLGRIKAKLQELGILDNTIIIFTSDHGSHFRTRNGEYKRSCHEASIKVPLVISGPGFEGGKFPEQLISLIDLPKTILHIAGAEEVPNMQGHDISTIVQDEKAAWPDDHFFQISESCIGRGIRTQQWKYCVEAEGSWLSPASSETYTEAFLYDLLQDPYEQTNLINDPSYETVRTEMKERLFKRMRGAGEEIPTIVPATL